MKEGWERKKLGEVCDFKSGTTIAVNLEKANGEIIYAKVGDMNLAGNEHFITGSSRYVDLKEINANQIIPKGSIIFPKRGGAIATNKKRRIIKPTIVDLNTMALVPSKIIDKDYLFFWFQQIDLSDLSNGTSIPQINNYSFDDVYISFPKSLPEQQHIVAILDESFVAIAKAKANAEQNHKNAKELFESYLQSVFAHKGVGWEEKSLVEVCDYDKTPNRTADLIYVGLEDIQSNTGKLVGPLIPRSVKSLTFHFNNEHVLYGRLRPYLNKVLLPDFEGHCSTEIFPIRPKKNILDRSFLFHWLIATETMNKINATWTGATLPRANMNAVLEFKINIPPIKEQLSIVNKLDSLSKETKKLEAIYQQKVNDLEELKKSVLQKAFNDELKTTNRHQYELERS